MTLGVFKISTISPSMAGICPPLPVNTLFVIGMIPSENSCSQFIIYMEL